MSPGLSRTVYDGGATHTTFDGKTADTVTGNLNGLNTEYFAGTTPTGPPLAFALGVRLTGRWNISNGSLAHEIRGPREYLRMIARRGWLPVWATR
jgi:hypothetical protein